MKARSFLALLLVQLTLKADSPFEIQRSGDQTALRWLASTIPLAGAISEYQVEVSTNLLTWEKCGAASSGSDGEQLELPFAMGSSRAAFFRLSRKTVLGPVTDSGAEVFGFSTAFRRHLSQLGEISTDEFEALFPAGPYLERIDWDPSTARFWQEFNTSPEEHNASLPLDDPERRVSDFRLNAAEQEIFRKNGFVVSRHVSWNFGGLLYGLYTDDLPLYLTSDVVLQAWHRSFASMLTELEETWFAPAWSEILARMAEAIEDLPEEVKTGALRGSLEDCDYYLGVARSLAAGTNVPCVLGQDAQVQTMLADIAGRAFKDVAIFGGERKIDFSQFEPRGYYANSEALSRYFQLLMWLGHIEFRLTPPPPPSVSDTERELATSALLFFLLKDSGQKTRWSELNDVLERFVGLPDSMNFVQLAKLLAHAGIEQLSDLADPAAIPRLCDALLAGNFGVQEILGHYHIQPGGKLPRSFLVFGQRFTPDSWALGKVVYDSIDRGGHEIVRRMPSPLDVGFSVLGNNATVPWIVAGIEGTLEPAFDQRDGFQYQHNLAAVRQTIDGLPAAFWEKNVYGGWLNALRALSKPTTDPLFPQALRTRAWAMKTLNTQFASWTQLRHDTVLYAKQSMTGGILCSYPSVFVEPVVDFWSAMERMAGEAADSIHRVRFPTNEVFAGPYRVIATTIQSNQVELLERFAEAAQTLRAISEKQISQTALNEQENEFLRNIVEIQKVYEGRNYTGWLPNLFYRPAAYSGHANWAFHQAAGIDAEDFLVTDVHTMPADIDHGGVLHQGVGLVRLAFLAVETGTEKRICAGPVFSHHDHPTAGMDRLTDADWKKLFGTIHQPKMPPWTSEFLAQ